MAAQTYQTLHVELETILAKLQDPELEIDEAIKLYEQGTKLVAQLEAYLQKAENKLTKLKQSTPK